MLRDWAQSHGYAWLKSKQHSKRVWMVQYHRKLIGTCPFGDMAKLREIIQKHYDNCNASMTAASTTTLATAAAVIEAF